MMGHRVDFALKSLNDGSKIKQIGKRRKEKVEKSHEELLICKKDKTGILAEICLQKQLSDIEIIEPQAYFNEESNQLTLY